MSVKTFLMTWTADGQFHPPAAYHGQLIGLGGFRGLVQSRNRVRLRSLCSNLMRMAVPTVHASASATDGGPVVETPKTTVGRLAESQRPDIVISENDIQAVLEKETGIDRLRVMFSKE